MLQFLGFKAIVWLASMLPKSWQYAIAHGLADLHYLFDRPARRSVQANLRVIWGGDASEALVRRESRWVFRYFGMYLCEFFGHRRFGKKFISEHVTVQGAEHLNAALAQGRGALFCSGHYSNWELGATVVAHMGYPILAVVQMHKAAPVNALFVRQREAVGVRVVHSQQGATAALKALRSNQTVAMLGDRPTGGPVVPVRMFGRRTYLPQGPWRIALASGAPILPTFVRRRLNGGFTLEIGAPLLVPQEGSRGEKLAALAQAWAGQFEARLKSDPAQWTVFLRVWDDPRAGALGCCQSLARAGSGTAVPAALLSEACAEDACA